MRSAVGISGLQAWEDVKNGLNQSMKFEGHDVVNPRYSGLQPKKQEASPRRAVSSHKTGLMQQLS